MKHPTLPGFALCLFAASALAQGNVSPAPSPEKRGLFSRVLHPFGGPSSTPLPAYNDPRLRGLVLSLQLSAEPVKLSEVRQLGVQVSLVNQGRRAVELNFATEQRIEIHLLSPTGKVLTKWSENRTFADTPALVLLNPQERIEYSETIATRELTAGKVFTVEAFFPQYPELKVRRKLLTAP